LDHGCCYRAKDLIVSLSKFFKISLSGGDSLIPLGKELELIRNYINIQRIARGKSIRLKIKIPQSIFAMPIIKLSIQPVVENAILHGFSGFRDDGTIAIESDFLDPETIRITIEDNGIGIPEKELADIQETLETYPLENAIRHFGLYNVNRRIKNMYGNEYGIRIGSEIGNYTQVIMTLPAAKLTQKETSEDV